MSAHEMIDVDPEDTHEYYMECMRQEAEEYDCLSDTGSDYTMASDWTALNQDNRLFALPADLQMVIADINLRECEKKVDKDELPFFSQCDQSNEPYDLPQDADVDDYYNALEAHRLFMFCKYNQHVEYGGKRYKEEEFMFEEEGFLTYGTTDMF